MASEIRVNKIENRSGLGTVTFADTGVDLAGIVTATTFSGSGASLTNVPDSALSAVTASKLSGALPAISGANLTALNGSNIASGTVADARISTLTASKLSGALPAISAANLTNVPAANLTGTLPALTAANLTNIPAANIVGVTTAGFSGSIIEIDCWNLTTNFTQPGSHGQYITSNWQRKPTHFTKKGTGMSESSGVFTFPKTGLYLIRVHMSVNTIEGNNLAYCGPYIQISTNSGGSYDRVSEGYTAMDHGTRYTFAGSEAIVNVTSVSLFKCRLETEASASFNVRASNGQSVIDFIRLGDST